MFFSQSWLETFIKEVEDELCLKVESQKNRFPSVDHLLRNFRKLTSDLLNNRNQPSKETKWQSLIEYHNEICVAYDILFQQNEHRCIKLEYEPKKDGTKKRVDFHAIFNSEKSKWIEVKTIHPENTTISEQKNWRKSQDNQLYFPPRTELVLFQDSDGANIWHDKFATRNHMLQYSLEFEKRIFESSIGKDEVCVLVLVGNGYDWRLDDLEDFVTFYQNGKHLLGDIFQKMENHYIQKENISLSKRINQFAYFKRCETSVKPELINWNVKQPNWYLAKE